ncbi:MAG: group 1 glycosyl transferase [Alphaproteobacteria bacterium]|nr:MAG: group 1 glycosyl transferase [Alphaproteobacteria bacterium]
MRVALIDPSLFTWPYDRALVEGLKSNGHDVILFTKYLSEDEQGKGQPNVREIFYPGLQMKFFKNLPKPVFLSIKGVSHFFSLIILWFHLKFYKPDAIHFQWAPLPIMDRFFIPLFKLIAPTVLTVHDSSPFNNNPSAAMQRIGAIKIFNSFDHLIVHTKSAVQALTEYGLNKEKISIVPHGFLESGIDAATAKRSIPPVMNFLLFGQIKPYKGVDVLIKAVAALPADLREKCHVHIVGKPQMDMEPLFAIAKDLGVESSIAWDLRFINDDEIGDLFSKADAMVLPYREIDASGVLMQLISVGKPVIASRIGLFAELLEDGKHGYLIEQDDHAGLAKAMSLLINDHKLCTTMGEHVSELQNSLPSWKDIGKMTSDIYVKSV